MTTNDMILLDYKAKCYKQFIQAQAEYNAHHKFSDLMKMLDNGIASNVYTRNEVQYIISQQDDIAQRILAAQFLNY